MKQFDKIYSNNKNTTPFNRSLTYPTDLYMSDLVYLNSLRLEISKVFGI
jgi:hypothetical protein